MLYISGHPVMLVHSGGEQYQDYSRTGPEALDLFASLNSHPKHSFCFCTLRLCYGLNSRLNFSLANCYPNTMLNKFLFLSGAPTNCSAALLSADQREKMRARLDQSGVRLRLSQPLQN